MTEAVPRFRMLQGVRVPSFFYGTAWKEERTFELVKLAFSAGFTAIDTANQRRHYFEAAVGEAVEERLSDGTTARSELFLQTKFTYFTSQDHRIPYEKKADFASQVRQSFASSLEHLRTSYVDSYVLHGPWTSKQLVDVDFQVWRVMEELQRAGQSRLIGVSNVSYEQLVTLFENADVKPAFVQNRCFARNGWDRKLRAFCREKQIGYQGFSLLTANQRELRHPSVLAIAERHDKTLPQIVFRFALQSEMIPLTGTSRLTHMREDLESFDFELTPEEVASIEDIASLR